jgi:hypothetical protein
MVNLGVERFGHRRIGDHRERNYIFRIRTTLLLNNLRTSPSWAGDRFLDLILYRLSQEPPVLMTHWPLKGAAFQTLRRETQRTWEGGSADRSPLWGTSALFDERASGNPSGSTSDKRSAAALINQRRRPRQPSQQCEPARGRHAVTAWRDFTEMKSSGTG